MGVLTTAAHEYWATVSGGPLDYLERQEKALWDWGVTAIEFRADLIPVDAYAALLARGAWRGPTLVAHFGTGDDAEVARQAVVDAISAGVHGGICHSRCELVHEIRDECAREGRAFAAAYHSQAAVTEAEAMEEFERQQALDPLFRKIAVRANRMEDALAVVTATLKAAADGGSPIVAAIFGPQRWARIVLPHAGSSISFIVADRMRNEVGGDDEQLQLSEVSRLLDVRSLMPAPAGAASSDTGSNRALAALTPR
jgi:3-dehydroquinate dehydratase